MRFPGNAVGLIMLMTCMAGAGPAAGADAATPAAADPGAARSQALHAPGRAVTGEEVEAAAAQLRADPNLGAEHKLRSLRWIASRTPDQPRKPAQWLAGLFEYLGQTAGLLLWAAGAIAFATAVVWAFRIFRAGTPVPVPAPAPAAARVEGMDIRPGSLPPDIGAAARALAEAGRSREALSLLYRGALSRAVHRFGVPIGESFTEGETLRAVGARFDASRAAYFEKLVGTWRRAVYAGDVVAREAIGLLCEGFASALDSSGRKPPPS